MKQLTSETFFGRCLTQLAHAIYARPRRFIVSQAVLFVLCVLYTVDSLEFNTDRNALVGSNQKYHENFLRLKQEFPQRDDLVVVVESDEAEKNRQFVERLGAKLEAATIQVPATAPPTNASSHRLLGWMKAALSKSEPVKMVETNLFIHVFYKGDLKALGSKALLFVPESGLRDLDKTLKDYRPFITQFTRATNLVSLFNLVNTQFRTASREDNAENRSLVDAMPALERIINQATAALKRPGKPPSPGLNALFNAGPEAEREIYITFDEGRLYLVNAQAATPELTGAAVERLRTLIEETRLEVPGVNVGLTGESVLELDEMAQSQKDTTVASVVSLILCALIFIYGYNETGRPIKAMICLVIGLGYTMAFATATIGHLNILTITFVPMLIGLAIDFGVHLVTRYEEELRHGQTELDALLKAMVFTGKGIFTGAITTAVGFLAMYFTGFQGIREMGVICGGGLLVCLIPMMTLLPALLLRGTQNVLDHTVHLEDRRARLENLWLARPMTTVVVTFALCLLSASFLNRVFFDYNLLNMQSQGLAAVQTEEKLISGASKSVIFGSVVATNLDHATDLEASIRKLTSVVTNVDSITRFLSENPTNKLSLIGDIKRDIASVHFATPDKLPVNISALSGTLYSLHGYLDAAQDEVKSSDPKLAKQLSAVSVAIKRLRKQMFLPGTRSDAMKSLQLADYQQALFDDVRETFHVLQTQDNRDRLMIEDLPGTLRDRFVGKHGSYLLMVYPVKNIWERAHQEEFIKALRQVDPEVTGTPVQLYEYTTLLKKSYEQAAWYSLAAISVMVLIHFRSLLALVLVLLPVGIGMLWLVGLMGYFGIPFNPANIMTLPLVIGIGVTNGIHILNRFAEEQNPGILAKSTGKAVLVSGLTTIAGFGSLVLAKHQGIESLGYVMATGTAACMIAALTFLPALLNLLIAKTKPRVAPEKKQPSADPK